MRQHQAGHPSPSINAAPLVGEKKAFFHEPTGTQAAAHAIPTPSHGISSSIHPFPRGHKVTERLQVPHAASPPSGPGLGGHIPAPGITFRSPGCLPSLAPGEDSAPSAFHPGADVRPRTVTPARSGGRTRTPCVPNCPQPLRVPARAKPQCLARGCQQLYI